MHKISCIVPVYNVERYVGKCVASLQNQTFRDLQIVLVDDGSTDSSGEICDRFAKEDSRIYVIHKENSGLGAARNTGLRAADGEYVFFVDSDDYVENTLAEKTIAAAQQFDADIVMYGYHKVSEDGQVLYSYDLPEMISDDQAYALSEKPEFLLTTPSACNKLYRKSLFEGIDFPARAWYEDLRTVPKLYPSAKKIYCMHNYFPYKYLTRDSSIMKNGNAERTKNDRIDAVNSLFTHYRDNDLFSSFENELNWVYIFHGYFLPCREIMNFNGKTVPVLRDLHNNLLEQIPKSKIMENPYLSTLSKRENLIFTLLYQQKYALLKLFTTVNHIIKK